ncbi:MAG: pentapeptide repeat-containing protein [Cyanobacteria bacterium J06635_15]
MKNYRGKSLKGVSFKGQNLTRADFSEADIRGANFSGAVLTGANFSHTISGQQASWIICIITISVTLAMVSGLLIAYASIWLGILVVAPKESNMYDHAEFFWISSFITLIMLIVSGWVIVYRGTGNTFSVLATIFVITVAFTLWAGEGESLAALIMQSVILATILAGIAVGALAVAIALSMKRKLVLPLIASMSCLAALVGAKESLGNWQSIVSSTRWITLSVGGIVTLSSVSLSTYIGYKAIAGHLKYGFTRNLAIKFSSLGGTRFNHADLTDADFTYAILRRADLRNSILKRTSWFQTRNLAQARLSDTYLENPQIRKLVVTKQGIDQRYDYLDLSGLNLQDAHLQNSSFISTNLSESILCRANLTGAKLARAQLYSSNMAEVSLTGAYIENWGISTDTRLTQVHCDYIFMRLPTQQDPDPCRKPDNRNEIFELGDFEDFIAPIIKTLDLYQQQNVDLRNVSTTYKTIDLFHHEGIDPRAAALALQQLTDQQPEAKLEVTALEGRGREKIRLQARVSNQVNRSELSEQYFENYGHLKKLPYADLQSLLVGVVEKDEQIRKLEELLERAIQQPRFYVETYQNQGEFIMSQSKGNISVSDVQGNVSGLAAAGENQTITGATLGEVSGAVTNTINQLSDSPISEQPSLKELLLQLQAVIESEPAMTEDDKVEAMEQVKILAEAGQKPEDGALKKAAKTAIKILKGTTASLSETTKLVKECSILLPAISALLVLI